MRIEDKYYYYIKEQAQKQLKGFPEYESLNFMLVKSLFEYYYKTETQPIRILPTEDLNFLKFTPDTYKLIKRLHLALGLSQLLVLNLFKAVVICVSKGKVPGAMTTPELAQGLIDVSKDVINQFVLSLVAVSVAVIVYKLKT